MDATVALSEAGLNVLLAKVIALAKGSDSTSKTWGPFTVGYSVHIALSGGSATLENAPNNLVHLKGVHVTGEIKPKVEFDVLGVLKDICFPPEPICIKIPVIGRVCLPRFCLPSIDITVEPPLPFSFDFDATFGLKVVDLGTQWGVVLVVFPFKTKLDTSSMGDALVDAIKQEVTSKLSEYPLGSLLASAVNAVLNAFKGILEVVASAFGDLFNAVFWALDLLNVAVPLTLEKFDKAQTFLPVNVPQSGDAPVRMTLSSVAVEVLDQELVVQGALEP